MSQLLSGLDSRLGAVEVALAETAHPTGETSGRAGKRAAKGSSPTVPARPVSGDEQGPLSDDELAEWLDETVRVGYFDRAATKRASDDDLKSVAKVPGLKLEDMQCGKGFCRATFSGPDGSPPDIGDLFGEPPFLSEGFTLPMPNGRMEFYFTQPGETLDNLRKEASASAKAGTYRR